jgi:hypothetical protein
MGKKIILVLMIMGSFTSHFSFGQENCDHCFEIEIFQNGQKVDVNNHLVAIKKEPFDIHIITNEGQGIVINTCLSDSNIISLKNGIPLDEMHFFQYGMAEYMFNPDQEILIHSQAPSYWFYDDSLNHRFSSVQLDNGKIRGIRHIQQMTNVETGDVLQPEQFPSFLYLGFISSVWNQETHISKEYQRDYLTIVFEDN